ncbi:Altronate oxidoreductase [Rhodovastum atsumiense]|uniref:Tagaturonate reductase n=1 Tax=Rhodovastum atsumiense TaxID=504468 RepID=A0A5M6IKE6_9PROT|nr:tagaturonate reductase [Rhodovastum atsumiense]KAA5608145.1 tagaturonate reductase [Rhodovastum atsumiense]CAH2599374.1 Altronate oxidoreductase [Rhodovastum atsumiense]
MEPLQRSRLAAGSYGVPHTPGAPVYPVNILQIGDGNFLRAFVDWMVDVCNGQGLFRGGVAIAQPLPQGLADRIEAQEGLFTVLLRGIENGQEVQSRRVVSCVHRALNPYDQWDEMRALAADPDLRFVVSNTTEAGIADLEEPFAPEACPASFPAKVAALLNARYQALGGSAAPGLVFIPCELIEANGSNLRRIVKLHAQRWALGTGFIDWLERNNHFLDTLVDRIVPGYPGAEADSLRASWGYDDQLIVAAEPFHLWVIQGPRALADEFPLHKAGLNVVWTDDLQPYRTRKVRILNGAHTASVLAAYCSGLDTVQQMMQDPVVSGFLHQVMFQEIVPFVPLPEPERQSYAATIVERFGNPFIRHELISIALNSVSKWKVRVLPTVKDFAAQRGAAPAGLSFSLAALLWFYRGQVVDGAYTGTRAAGPYPIRDDAAVIAKMASAWEGDDPSQAAALLLGDASLWGEDLTTLPGFSGRVMEGLLAIASKGMKAALQQVVATG